MRRDCGHLESGPRHTCRLYPPSVRRSDVRTLEALVQTSARMGPGADVSPPDDCTSHGSTPVIWFAVVVSAHTPTPVVCSVLTSSFQPS
jgi:hypothetical protein